MLKTSGRKAILRICLKSYKTPPFFSNGSLMVRRRALRPLDFEIRTLSSGQLQQAELG